MTERILSAAGKMRLLQTKQTNLRNVHKRLLSLSLEVAGDPMKQTMVQSKISKVRGDMMNNRTGPEGLRALNTQLEGTRSIEPALIRDLRRKGIKIKKYEETHGYRDDRNMI